MMPSQSDQNNIIHMYTQLSLSLKTISTKSGYSPYLIKKILMTNNIPMKKSGGQVTFNVEKAIKLYNQTHSINKVADQLGVNKTAVYNQLVKHGISFEYHNQIANKKKNKAIELINTGHRNTKEIAKISSLSKTQTTELFKAMNTCTDHSLQVQKRNDIINNLRNKNQFSIEEVVSALTKINYTKSAATHIFYTNCTPDDLTRINTSKTIKQHNQQIIFDKWKEIECMMDQQMSISAMATELKVPATLLKKELNRKQLKYTPSSFNIPYDIFIKLTNKDWIIQQANDPMTNATSLALDEFNNRVSPDSIRFYFRKMGYEIKNDPVETRVPELLDKNHIASLYEKMSYREVADEMGVSHPTLRKYMRLHNIEVDNKHQISKFEKQVVDFIKSIYSGPIIENTRTIIGPKELDIFLPKLNLAVECCGLYWHSERFKPNSYHLNKLQLCSKQNVRLITLFEDEWTNNKSLVERKLKHLITTDTLRIYARNTTVDLNVSADEARMFLNTYHIQGYHPSSIRLGLRNNVGELIALMTFKKRKGETYELNRYVTGDKAVIGGFSKLLKHFTLQYSFEEIVSFADLRWSELESNVYIKNNFTLQHVTKPAYWYIDYKTKIRKHRMIGQRKNLIKLLGTNFNPEMTERQNMNSNNYYAIYDCGHAKYIMKG